MVNEVNRRNDISWVAGINSRFEGITEDEFRKLNGAKVLPESEKNYIDAPVVSNLPEEFDSRKNWPKCKTIGKIYD